MKFLKRIKVEKKPSRYVFFFFFFLHSLFGVYGCKKGQERLALPLPKEMFSQSGQEKVPCGGGEGGVFIEQDASNIFVVCLRRSLRF